MIKSYFGFKREPFGATPDPQSVYYSSDHREALASLKVGFHNNRGFTALVAPPGMGKTTLLFLFLEYIRNSSTSAFLFDIDSHCGPSELFGYILRDIDITPGQTNAEMHEQLNTVLMAEARAGRRFVIVIDEAQNLSEEVLETVRLLTNFESPGTKLVQVVLAGQPQLAEKLTRPSLVQLRQRISTACQLKPFSQEESRAYIEHQIKTAGYCGASLFTEEAATTITEVGRGIPRVINNVCFNSLALCRALKREQVDAGMVAEVLADEELMHKGFGEAILPLHVTTNRQDEAIAEHQRRGNGSVRLWRSRTANSGD
jgi:type II secretory pathway predicted ATPase ExeA